MGFGSYDESEQENREMNTDIDDEDTVTSGDSHEGNVSFEFDTSNDELLDRLQDMKDQEQSD
jgi:hypothetical protein